MRTTAITVIARKELVENKIVVCLLGVTSFTLLTWLGAYVYIPLKGTPIPITMQTLFVFLSGAILGKKLGVLSQTLYLTLGAVGIPFFAEGRFGIFHLFGPTGGYILGFVAASYIIGRILEKKEGFFFIIAAFIIGAIVIFTFGAGWLAFGLGFGIKKALYIGLMPFIPGCIMKIAVAAAIAKSCLKRSKQLFY
jgi:biotin transport system substrate-specific component